MSLKDEIYQLYSQRQDNKILISQAQQILIADDKTEKSLRHAFINCAAALMSDSALQFNNQPIVLQLIELASKLSQLKPDDHEYLTQLNAYLMLSLTEYSSHLDQRLISRALFGKIPPIFTANSSSKQLSISIDTVHKSSSPPNINLSSDQQISVQQTMVKSSDQQAIVDNSTQQALTINSTQNTVAQLSVTQTAVKSSALPPVAQQGTQQYSQISTTTSSIQQNTPKNPAPQLAINIKPAKKPLEIWRVSTNLIATKHILH